MTTAVLEESEGTKPSPSLVTAEKAAGDHRLREYPTEAKQVYPEVGFQYPSYFHAPAWDVSDGEDVAFLAETAGIPLLPWQRIVIENACAVRADGRWSAFELGLIAPRQNGKNVTITARQLAGLFLFGESQIHTAHLFKTAKSAFRDLKSAIERVPELRSLVKITTASQNLSVEMLGNSDIRIDFVARAGGSGRGLSADTVYLDEAFNLSQELVADLLPTLSSKPAPQLWYTSSAGMEASDALADLRERALDRPETEPRLAYFEYSVPKEELESTDLESLEAVQRSNPSLGYFQSWEWIESVDLKAMPEEQYRRERLGIWADAAKSAVISAEVWKRAMVVPDEIAGLQPIKQSVALEVSGDRDMAVIAGAAELEDGRVLVEIIEQKAGTAWIASRLKGIQARTDIHAGVVYDNFSAASAVVPHLIAADIEVAAATTKDLTVGSALVYDALHYAEDGFPDPQLIHTGESGFLDDAVYASRKRMIGQSKTAWTWGPGPTEVALEPLRAITLAVRGLSMEPIHKPKKRRRAF